MPEFNVNGVVLDIPADRLSRNLEEALQSGKYEHGEAAALAAHLKPDDRFLDLGAGAGYLMVVAGRLGGTNPVAGVEAGPEMAEVARKTLSRNGVKGQVMWGAVVPDSHPGGAVPFRRRKAFWASSLAADGDDDTVTVDVPALRLGDLLAQHRPSVICVDIEGAELGLFGQALPADLRLVVMEIHPGQYGGAGVQRLFAGLGAAGFAYHPRGSRGAVVVFSRDDI